MSLNFRCLKIGRKCRYLENVYSFLYIMLVRERIVRLGVKELEKGSLGF